MMEMNWRGEQIVKWNPRVRRGQAIVPQVIANHISIGTMKSMFNTFSGTGGKSASSHFGIGRDGVIDQYVRIENAAWTQGLTTASILNPSAETRRKRAPIVLQMGINPNLYCVSIEHEGYADQGGDGTLTEEQFWSSCWLHKYIQTEVERIFGFRIPLNSSNVIGHFQIDPVRKPFCPGPAFPWTRLYAELAVADGMDFETYEERIDYQRGQASKFAAAYAIAERIRDLEQKLTGEWAPRAEQLLLSLEPILPAIDYREETVTAAGIARRVKALYETSHVEGRWQLEAVRKLMILESIMKDRGLL